MVLALMVTKQCNFHCGHCMVNSSPQYSCVSDSILEKYCHMLRIGHPDKVYLLGGEPFLHIDTVEKIVEMTRPYCSDILIFSNGSFLLDHILTDRIKKLGVTVRISDDRFHRKSWSEKLERLINESEYLVVRKNEPDGVIPVGRAYEDFKHLKYNLGCSLLNKRYDSGYVNHHRYMIMLNGDVNLYCAAIEGALANVFEDEEITYDLLVEREKILHNYLMREVIKSIEDTYMAVLCNKCSKYKITKNEIIYDGVVVAKTEDYCSSING